MRDDARYERHRRDDRLFDLDLRSGHARLTEDRLAEGPAVVLFLHQPRGAEIGIALEPVVARPRPETRRAEPLGAGEILGLVQGAAGDGGHAQRLDVAVGRGAPVKDQILGAIGVDASSARAMVAAVSEPKGTVSTVYRI